MSRCLSWGACLLLAACASRAPADDADSATIVIERSRAPLEFLMGTAGVSALEINGESQRWSARVIRVPAGPATILVRASPDRGDTGQWYARLRFTAEARAVYDVSRRYDPADKSARFDVARRDGGFQRSFPGTKIPDRAGDGRGPWRPDGSRRRTLGRPTKEEFDTYLGPVR